MPRLQEWYTGLLCAVFEEVIGQRHAALPLRFVYSLHIAALEMYCLSWCAGNTDSHKSTEEGTSRNAKPGEFAPSDPKKPDTNTPENAREKGGQ